MKKVWIHLGPHKTGSTSIQRYLGHHADVLEKRYDTAYISKNETLELSRSLKQRAWLDASEHLIKLRSRIVSTECQNIIVSDEDLSGDMPGRSGTKRVYPRIFEHSRLMLEAMEGFDVKFLFLRRDEDHWIRSVYIQLLKHRQKFSSLDEFHDFLRFDDGWEGVTKKVKQRLGDQFCELSYVEDPQFNSIAALADEIPAIFKLWREQPESTRNNIAPPSNVTRVLEIINQSGSSMHAKSAAKELILDSGKKNSQHQAQPPSNRKWPIQPLRQETLPEELDALWKRVEMRVSNADDQPNLLPRFDADLQTLRTNLVSGPAEFPGGKRQYMNEQKEILKYRFRGLPEICFVNAMAISYLRRDTKFTTEARRIFFRLWDEEFEVLLAILPTRWLISTLQTFMDHGRDVEEIQIGTAGYFFSNTLKAYEAERALEGLNPNAVYPNTKPVTENGFKGLDRFKLGGSDLMVNTLAILLELSSKSAPSGRVLIEFLLRLKHSHSLFSRMDQSRIRHGVEIPGFGNCWSFFEEPDH